MFKRNCVVKYTDNFGVEHSAEVEADSLFEAAIRGLYKLDSSFATEQDVFDRWDITVEVHEEPATHTVKSGLTGVYSLSWFGVAFKSSTFRDNGLEIRLETLIGNFSLSGRYSEGILSGDWSTDSGLSGKWEAKKVLEPSSH